MYGEYLTRNRACIILNGVVDDYTILKNIILSKKYSTIIGIDGGANHLYNMELTPSYVVGDLDSIEDNVLEYFTERGSEFYKYTSKKNETDSELGIMLAIEKENMCIDFYAALGGRIDHELANIGLLYYCLQKGLYPRIITENEDIYILENDEITIEGSPGDLLSVIPFKGDAKGVSLRGLEYPLDEFDIEYSSPRGISNVMIDDICEINVNDGCILIIKFKNSRGT